MDNAAPLIIGSGIAGLWTAWRLAAEGRRARLVTKETLADSASAWAQGGIAVALGPGDNPVQHAADTLAAGDGLSDPEAVRILTNEGPDRIRELLAMGATFDRAPDGRLRFGLEAAHTRPRIIHAGGDRTGAALVAFLTGVIREHPLIEILEHTEARALIVEEGRVTGVLLVQPDRSAFAVRANAVVLATGGVGQLYAVTTNPRVATADGWAMAHQGRGRAPGPRVPPVPPHRAQAAGREPRPAHLRGGPRRRRLCWWTGTGTASRSTTTRGESWPRGTCSPARSPAPTPPGGAWLDARQVPDFARQFPGHLPDAGEPRARRLAGPAAGGTRASLCDGRHPDQPRRPHASLPGLWAVGECAHTGRARGQSSRLELSARGPGVRRPGCPCVAAGRHRRTRARPARCPGEGLADTLPAGGERGDTRGDARRHDRRRGPPTDRALAAARGGDPRGAHAAGCRRATGGPRTSCWWPR